MLAVAAAAGLLLGGCTGGNSAATGSAAVTGAAPAGSSATIPTAPTTSAAGPADRQAEQFTPLLMTVPTTPHWFTGSDGAGHLTYEVQLTNAFPVPVTLTGLVVKDADTGTTLQTLSGDQLSATVSLLTSGSVPTTEIAPSAVAVAWMDVPLAAGQTPPARITHELTTQVPPGLPLPETIVATGASADVDVGPAIVIGPPLEGPGWYALGSCCDGPHRRTAQPINGQLWVSQRYAIDFNRLDDRGFILTGDPSRNESYPTYDQPVMAVADAQVVQAADQYPDQVPEAAVPVTIEEADGNYVILELSDGVYAFYAHLKPGTVQVSPGDRVAKGQEIGRTGNSGSSTGPHLHFQLMDRPSALAADGLPYEFDRFTVTGRGPSLQDLLTSDPATTAVPIDPATAGPRIDQLPLSRDVVAFAVTEAAASASPSSPGGGG